MTLNKIGKEILTILCDNKAIVSSGFSEDMLQHYISIKWYPKYIQEEKIRIAKLFEQYAHLLNLEEKDNET